MDIVYLNQQYKIVPERSFELLSKIEHIFSFEWLKERIKDLDLESNAEFEQREILIQTIRFQKLNFIKILMNLTSKKEVLEMPSSEMKKLFMANHSGLLGQYFLSLKLLRSGSPINLTSLSVTVDRLNFINF